jgi:hypothetical protein
MATDIRSMKLERLEAKRKKLVQSNMDGVPGAEVKAS